MSKITVIGDIHGHSIWKEIVEREKDSDKFIFMGDYFDSFEYTPNIHIQNFQEILSFKKNSVKEVILLIGNNDYHYLDFGRSRYTGFENGAYIAIKKILMDSLEDIQMAYEINNILFTHAGYSRIEVKPKSVKDYSSSSAAFSSSS